MSSGLASADSKGMGWSGKDGDFVDQLIYLGFRRYLDIETEYEVSVGKGGPNCEFFHHYIVLESSQLPMGRNRLIFELSKTRAREVIPNVRVFSCDGNPDYKITITTTLRWLAELASKVMYLLGPYNLINASCQTFSDEFLKQLGSSGYMTYVKSAATAAAVVGIVSVAAGVLYWLSSGNKKDETEDSPEDSYDSDY